MGLRSEIVGDRLFFNDGEHLFQPVLNFFVVIVGLACNFKCRDCANFVPYMPKKYYRYDVESIIANIRIMLKALSHVNHIQIQGGEPFIYSDLGRLVEFISQCKNVGGQVIATNGSILPSDEVMSILRDNNVFVRISNYGLYPEKITALMDKCERFGVRFNTYDFATHEAMWYDTGGIDNLTTPPHYARRRVSRERLRHVNFKAV